MTQIRIELVTMGCGILSGLLAVRVDLSGSTAPLADDDIAFIVKGCLDVRKIYPSIDYVVVEDLRKVSDHATDGKLVQLVTILKENSFMIYGVCRPDISTFWLHHASYRVLVGNQKEWDKFNMTKINEAVVRGKAKLPGLGENKGISVFFASAIPIDLVKMEGQRVGLYTIPKVLEVLYER